MTSVHHIARATGSATESTPAYEVALRAGRHELVADEPPNAGGRDAGTSPFGLLLAALAACTVNTLRMYADRKGWVLASIDVDVRYDVDDDGTRAITRTITLPAAMPAEQRARLEDIAQRTPVTRALREGTAIDTTVHATA